MPRPNRPYVRTQTGWWQTEIHGVVYKLVHGPERKAEAFRRFHELMAEVADNPPVDGGDPTVASLLEAYLEFSSRRDRPRTFSEKKLLLRRFDEAHGSRRVREMKAFHLSSWVAAQAGWESEWSRANGMKAIKAAFAWAHRQELIDRNPFSGLRSEGEEKRSYRPIERHEFLRLLRAARAQGRREKATSASRRFREALWFLRWSGVRPSELESMTWSMIDLEVGLVTMDQHKTRIKTKRPRCIALVPRAVRLLKAIGERDGFEENVFRSHRGRPWARGSLQQYLRRLRQSAGVPDDVVLYGNRHAFATGSIRSGVGLAMTARLMGHKNTRVLERYLHLEDVEELNMAARQATSGPRRSSAGDA